MTPEKHIENLENELNDLLIEYEERHKNIKKMCFSISVPTIREMSKAFASDKFTTFSYSCCEVIRYEVNQIVTKNNERK